MAPVTMLHPCPNHLWRRHRGVAFRKTPAQY